MQNTHPIGGISLEHLRRPRSTSAAVVRLAPAVSQLATSDDAGTFTLAQRIARVSLTLFVMVALSAGFATQVHATLR